MEQTGTTREMAPCSIELTRNAKGEAQWVVKQYHVPGAEDEAMYRLRYVDHAMAARYRPDLLSQIEQVGP